MASSPQRAPLGYINNDRATRTIKLDQSERASLIRKAFEMYDTGNYTLRQVQEAVNALGLTGRPKSGTRKNRLGVGNYQTILRNPVYYGLIRYNGRTL